MSVGPYLQHRDISCHNNNIYRRYLLYNQHEYYNENMDVEDMHWEQMSSLQHSITDEKKIRAGPPDEQERLESQD